MGKLTYTVRLRVLQNSGTELGALNLTEILSLFLALVQLGVEQSKLQENGHSNYGFTADAPNWFFTVFQFK